MEGGPPLLYSLSCIEAGSPLERESNLFVSRFSVHFSRPMQVDIDIVRSYLLNVYGLLGKSDQ